MILIAPGTRGCTQLWEFKAQWPDGSIHVHQGEMPMTATQAGVLEHLKSILPHMRITSLDRVDAKDYKPPVGPIHRSNYQCGAWDAAVRELNGIPETNRKSVMDDFRKDRLLNLAGVTPERKSLVTRSLVRT